MRSIAITSGKGGVGKSTVVANLAYLMAKMGKRVMILDADLGLGNIDILYDLKPSLTLKDVIDGKTSIEKIILSGPLGIKVIPAPSGVEEMINLHIGQKRLLLEQVQKVIKHVDIFLIDTAPGISSNVIFFNLAASEIFLIVSPDPCSLIDGYALMKVLALNHHKHHFNLIVNHTKGENEAKDIYERLEMMVSRFLKGTLSYMGYIPFDPKITLASRKKKLFVEVYPDSEATHSLMEITKRVFLLPEVDLKSEITFFK
jgi:flagellar biosynthesis protein FlhG